MDKKTYYGALSKAKKLNDLLLELDKCQKEKDELLAEISKLEEKGELDSHLEDITKRMKESETRFKECNEKLHKLKKV